MKMPIEIGLVILTAYVLGLSLYPVFIRLYSKNNLIDKRESRKVHLHEVPTMGGIPIFIAFVVTIFIWLPYTNLADNRYLIGSLLFMLFIGLRDDFVNLKPLVKLFSQVVPALVIFYFTDVRISSLYGLILSDPFPIYLSLPITIFTIIVITNSINLIDGLDGLAGSISLVVLTSLGLWFSLTGNSTYGILLFAMSGSLIAFLHFNWQPAKIFMGDTGALILGFLASVSIIKFINYNSVLPLDSGLRFSGVISTAVAILIIPLFDTLRIFTLRLIQKKSPFSADKNHVHHVLLRLGMSHKQVTILLTGINLNFIVLAWIFRNIGDAILLPLILVVGIFLSLLLDYIFIKKVLIRDKNDKRSVMDVIKSSRKAS